MREKGAGSFENTRVVAGVARRTAIHQCRGTRDFDREFGYPPGVINKAMVVRAEALPASPSSRFLFSSDSDSASLGPPFLFLFPSSAPLGYGRCHQLTSTSWPH